MPHAGTYERVLSDDAYQAMDPELNRALIDAAMARIDPGKPSDEGRTDGPRGGVDWHIWVVDG